MNNAKKILIVLLLFVLSSTMAAGDATQLWLNDLFAGNLGVPFTNWYDVADWETKVCFDWGGDTDPNEVFGETMQGEIYHNLVVTIQAQVRDPIPEEYEAHVGERLYEVAWYVQPTETDEDMNYEVYLSQRYGGKKVLASGNANYVNGFRDYFAEYSNANYTKAVLRYWNTRTDDTLEVPVIG